MKKILLIPLLLLVFQGFSQTVSLLKPKGGIFILDTVTHHLNIIGTYLLAPNDSTINFDSSKVVTNVTKNAAGDSFYIYKGDIIASRLKDSSGGGAASQWTTNGTSIYYNTGNVGIGITAPLAKLQIDITGINATAPDSSKGIYLRNPDAATSGAQKYSPAITWEGGQFQTGGAGDQQMKVRAYLKPVTGSFSTNGYLTYGAAPGTGIAYTDDILTIGTSNGVAQYGVGIGGPPSGSYPLSVTGAMSISSVILFSSTVGLQTSSGNFLDVSSSIVRAASGSGYLAFTTDKPMKVGGLTQPTAGAMLDVNTISYAFLPPRMTTAQRDSINLTVTSVTVTNGGTGYTTNPTVIFANPPTGGVLATGTSNRTGTVVTSITVSVAGSYITTPAITFFGGGGSGATATANMTQVLTKGMTIYNTTTDKIQTWNGTTWNDLF